MQFQGPHGQLMLFLGNKAEVPLQRLICVVPPSGQFAFQQGPVPSTLDPKKQMQVTLPRPSVSLCIPVCSNKPRGGILWCPCLLRLSSCPVTPTAQAIASPVRPSISACACRCR